VFKWTKVDQVVWAHVGGGEAEAAGGPQVEGFVAVEAHQFVE
jgi:hypothetical protein